MSLFIGLLVVAVYGGSGLIIAGCGVAWKFSSSFRRSLVGDVGRR